MMKLLIGRSAECDICYDGIFEISSKHAEITVGDDGRVIFTDYSTNGSCVNGQMVHHASVMVNYGDAIVFPGNIAFDWNMVSSRLYANKPEVNAVNPQPPVENSRSNTTLSFSQTMTEGFSSGFRNGLSFVGAVLLYILTIWIPYINIGTTIAMSSLSLQYAKGETFNPLIIFESRYRRIMGGYFLLATFRSFVILTSIIFMFFPSIVTMLSLLLSSNFLIEEDQDPIKAMQSSNRATYGSKWTILGVMLVFMLCSYAVLGLFAGLAVLSSSAGIAMTVIVGIIAFFVSVVMMSVYIGLLGSMWNQLKNKTNY